MKEKYYDELLNIKTGGNQMGFNKSLHYHRYEPTPYRALEQLFKIYEVKSSDRIVDFGCGKGRLNFFIAYLYNASVVGVEMNQEFYLEAVENHKNYMKKVKNSNQLIEFYCCLAEEYKVDYRDNRFYFFNPFSVQIFMRIVKNILISFEEKPRQIELILYYGSEEYIYFLENSTAFQMKEEIMLPNLTETNSYEKFVIYQLKY